MAEERIAMEQQIREREIAKACTLEAADIEKGKAIETAQVEKRALIIVPADSVASLREGAPCAPADCGAVVRRTHPTAGPAGTMIETEKRNEGLQSTNLSDQMVNSALRYRAQAPLVEELLRELGLSGREITGLTQPLHAPAQGNGSSGQADSSGQ